MAENSSKDIYESFNLYIHPDKFFLEPRDLNGGSLSNNYLEIDRHTNAMKIGDIRETRIPIIDSEIKFIYGIVGTIPVVSGKINKHNVWEILQTELIAFKKTTLHLTEKQIRYNRLFSDMVTYVMAIGGFYYSTSLDITRTLQWLHENDGPTFRASSMADNASERFVWNGHLLKQIRATAGTERFCLPVMHGFFGQTRSTINNRTFKLTLISRRSIYRAGVRYYKRGVDVDGHAANFVETEQIVEFEGQNQDRHITSFVQIRGSIPLLWTQKPNLRWQPTPKMKPTDDQLAAFQKSFSWHRKHYGGKHVIVNLINQKGREKKIGSELERVCQQANIDFVRYQPFDFHKECHAGRWDRLSLLRDMLVPELHEFGYYYFDPKNSVGSGMQTGFFRTNCIDCLDRTNVVQAMLARVSLTTQLQKLGIISEDQRVETIPELEHVFKHLWADNGDQCSRQYAGTGALKADFTRLGRRTYYGAMNDGVNAVTRYFRNNFIDGYRQDAIDLFLGNFIIDNSNLPSALEVSLFSTNQNGVALIGAMCAMAMTVLCVLVAENVTATIFWLIVFFICLLFIFINGEEFVNAPKLKID
ncbi:unnamed protein product [Caenorhabditis auriculariae]|uniref:Phosphatidylinositol-3-phosphatase SAC1 n=1 Tax=Caenorhabditis auriculariae TaxID=2777116 RepID=A0A8S1GYF5_9PELO|nr:unnamed protein product [Caenorhabditis auriculariae]